ncbi:MAG: MgtC/SapB family protein [Oscillospiraceae bacterium]|nr:MgtC/SapB family protein [Oscillospiraceae bacterium]
MLIDGKSNGGIMQVREVTYLAIAVRIAVAVILGGIIGLERGLKNRPAGLRTYMLVCVGACLIMVTNQYIYQAFGTGDPVRMGAQVVSGIGFLGAGTIVVTKRNQIKGLTTAAGLWAAAAVGLSIGIGLYEAAVMGGAVIFIVLSLIHSWDNKMRQNSKMVEIYIELTRRINLGDFLRKIHEMDLEIESIQTEQESAIEEGKRAYIIILKAKRKRNHEILFQNIRDIEGVAYVEGL